ncbi:hypothetical protein EUTSA_v10008779mg [Eutrema salsugineum]|uniref:Band 7 domain-containing protein n=1 Tax=Eutrema salsugineum TaxID=72664 RepID=V4LAI4_EUTSA|nr:hypersensitive-induced response protein-like protein 1 [Eutrema salsugineum]ESQ36778.1 hypothetical protein EUTSA_v10008779mg [Eutrema salsugineum]
MGNFFGCFHVEEYSCAIKEKNGKFKKELKPGYHCVPWFCCHCVVGTVSMKIQQICVSCHHKTKDNVFVILVAAIHFQVLDGENGNNPKKAFYVHTDSRSLIKDYAFDIIKTTISHTTFDELFEKKDDFVVTVNDKLSEKISDDYGYGKFKTLIVDISPEESTKRTINLTNAAPKMSSALTGATPEVIDMLRTTQYGAATLGKDELPDA